jgi:hypothetical protein
MRSGTYILLAFILTTIASGSMATAADFPKEGTYSGTYSNPGTYKAFAVGKERFVAQWEADGLSVGTGFLDHTTWHCFGLNEATKGMEQWHGYCVMTDPAGDQILADVAGDGAHAMDAKSYGASGTFTAGTGKFAGISGGITFVCQNTGFRTAAAGTYGMYATVQGNYKLP